MLIVFVLLCALALPHASTRATPEPQTDAAAVPLVVTRIVVASGGRATVTLENRSTLSATAWSVRVDLVLGSGERQSIFTGQDKFRSLASVRAGFVRVGAEAPVGPLEPGSTRESFLGLPPSTASATAVVLAAVFEDGSSAGRHDDVKQILDRREAAAAAAEEWLAILQGLPSAPDAAMYRRNLREVRQKAKPPRKGIVEDHDVPQMIDRITADEGATLEELHRSVRGIELLLHATIVEGRKHHR